MVRLCVGIEHIEDLRADLDRAGGPGDPRRSAGLIEISPPVPIGSAGYDPLAPPWEKPNMTFSLSRRLLAALATVTTALASAAAAAGDGPSASEQADQVGLVGGAELSTSAAPT